jgi:hypothetical protein
MWFPWLLLLSSAVVSALLLLILLLSRIRAIADIAVGLLHLWLLWIYLVIW